MTTRHYSSKIFCVAFAMYLAALVAPNVVTANTAPEHSYHVIDGQNAPPGKYPWMVALMDRAEMNRADNQGVDPEPLDARICGGTLIAQKWVLTAAHCVIGYGPREIDIGIGSRNFNKLIRFAVKEIVIHRDYANHGYRDIALIKLKVAVPSHITPIKLIASGSRLPNGTPVTSLGWGVRKYNRDRSKWKFPNILQEVQLQTDNNETCKSQDDQVRFFPLHELCIVAPFRDRLVCKRDSGGPAVYFNQETNEYFQAGIVSWSTATCDTTAASIHTRLSGSVNWIQSHIRGESTDGKALPYPTRFLHYCDGRDCLFNANIAAQTDPKRIVSYLWETDDGGRLEGAEAVIFQHRFRRTGNNRVKLTLIHEDAHKTTRTRVLTIFPTSSPDKVFKEVRTVSRQLTAANDYYYRRPAYGYGSYHAGGIVDIRMFSQERDREINLELWRYIPEKTRFQRVASSTQVLPNLRVIRKPMIAGLYTVVVRSNFVENQFSLTASMIRKRSDVCLTDSFLNCRRRK